MVTARVSILDKNNQAVQCRTLIDTCATANFITDRLANKLNLPKTDCTIPIGALNSLSTISKHAIMATIRSNNNKYACSLTFLTIPEISSAIPDQPIDRRLIKIPKNIKLADPEFHQPAPIDLLLGAGTALSLLCVGQIDLTPSDGLPLFLQKTRLGWVIGGSVPNATSSHTTTYHANTPHLLEDISRFWELDEGPQVQHLSRSEKICEEHFKTNVTRNEEGRYIVALPFNDKIVQLGHSKQQAMKRLISLERKLKQDAALQQRYHSVLQEYLDLGHMSKITSDNPDLGGFYLPHHGVVKTTSQTTKLRVVFDGSAKSTSGISLNDTLHTGPKIQEDLLYILLRFRIHRFVLTGDIEKMYRQFLVRPEDRKFQKILWRDTDGQIQTYQLNTVTFGLSAAPYLAIRCLQKLADDEEHKYPCAAKILHRDFYVDDVLTGTSTKEEAVRLRKELTSILKEAGLYIRQWASNNRELLDGLAEQDINQNLAIGESSTLKTLGVYWNSSNDLIHYAVKTDSRTNRTTKRLISSEIAKIYDPLGLLGPVIVLAKILLQKLWTLKVDWDESLPLSVQNDWDRYYRQLPLLNSITFDRNTIINSPVEIQLHGFCDASEKAFGACIYLRSIDKHGRVLVKLLVAKSRVAPLKQHTIPRLELSGALLLASLYKTIEKSLHIPINRHFFWTDSTIVLHWLSASPGTLKTFVANRVAEIQRNSNVSNWHHVKTKDNPADLISRGQTAEEFLQPSIWSHGPLWLSKDETYWPAWELSPIENLPDQKKACCLATVHVDTSIFEKYSSWEKLIRVVARCLQWRSKQSRKEGLNVIELQNARNRLLKLLQQHHFADEIQCISKGRTTDVKGKLQRLNPFLDKDGILRVGGRLKHSTMPFSQKHPIILPKSTVTTRIIEQEHRSQLHTGTQATLYAIRKRYWPIDGRSQVWKTIKDCVRCRRLRPPPVEYLMGDLPEARVTEARPFSNVGVDYCGPFYIKEKRHRNRNRIKVYVAVFVCLAIKAVHLELVTDLTSDAFIAALRRFIARRGHCINMYSDNGTNFVGANNELRELRDLLQSDQHHKQIKTFLANKFIQWHFMPPHTPHFGGLWEAAVKAFKYHLKRVVGSELFTFEEFNTLIIEIESILNSRPLTPISSDPNDLLVLSPSHFLIGESLMSLPERDFRDVPPNRLSRWKHIQQVKQHFWTRWRREYLNEITSRNKWMKGSHIIKEGSIVLLREDNVPPAQWPLGRVVKVHPGSDGIIRTVTVKTSTTVLDRSVKKLVPLLNQSQDETTTHPAAKGDETTPEEHPTMGDPENPP